MGCRSHVPGWHVSTLEWQQSRKLQLVGIVQEQHPDRARLFMQWKRMSWPVLADPLNQLGVAAVPITLLIDEHGIIRKVNPSSEDVAAFVETPVEGVSPRPAPPVRPDLTAGSAASDRRSWAEAAALWGAGGQLDEALRILEDLLSRSPADGALEFRAGVAFRKRHDSASRQPGDFQAAVRHWTRALEIDPNQYIWRRRVQQYGPRLAKPYAFYDWVPAARREITARGETPVRLAAEPGGAEFAAPAQEFPDDPVTLIEPDPGNRIHLDAKGLIQTEITVVPARVKPGEAARVHVEFKPNSALRAHWNNEVEGLAFFLRPPTGARVDRRLHRLPLPAADVTQETRTIECEIVVPAGAVNELEIPAYALYYVCEDVTGTCLYRRQNVTIRIPLLP